MRSRSDMGHSSTPTTKGCEHNTAHPRRCAEEWDPDRRLSNLHHGSYRTEEPPRSSLLLIVIPQRGIVRDQQLRMIR